FYYPFLLIFPGIWGSLIIFRPFAWREWVSPVIGLITPYIFALTWFMYTDNLTSFFDIWQPFIVDFPTLSTISPVDYIALVPLLILLALSAHKMWVMYFKNVVLIRKSQVSLGLLTAFIVVSYFLSPEKHLYHFAMLAVPFAVFLAYYFITAWVKWFYETLFVLLLGSIFYFRFVYSRAASNACPMLCGAPDRRRFDALRCREFLRIFAGKYIRYLTEMRRCHFSRFQL